MYIPRLLESELKKRLIAPTNKVLIIYGARQTGKTTLLKRVVKGKENILWFEGDETEVRELFDRASSARFRTVFGTGTVVVIDEAQNIPDIGLKLKIIFDHLPDIRLLVSGSSTLDLSGAVTEPLTGRKLEYKLFPFSFEEMVNYHGLFEESRRLEQRMIYGYYPDIVTAQEEDARIFLKELTGSYLFKDILNWNKIRKPDKLVRLVQALTLQTGQQVSYHELGEIVSLDNETVENYIDLLEKSFVIYRLMPFSRNLRNEIKRSRKIYFYDNGIRNALINNFNFLNLREDTGKLWENFLITERIKYTEYHKIPVNRYFWRTHSGQEIDYIEERNGKLYAYEFTWNPRKKKKIPKAFLENYQVQEAKVIHKDNFHEFILAGTP